MHMETNVVKAQVADTVQVAEKLDFKAQIAEKVSVVAKFADNVHTQRLS